MNKLQTATTSAKNYVRKHRVAVAVVATTVVCGAINRAALKQHNEFLKEEGLYEEFYTPEESY
jgi:hypothetical protein